jgi:uncharacterized Zn finger protein
MSTLTISFQQLQAQVGMTTYARGQDVLQRKKVLRSRLEVQDDDTVQINATTRGSNDEAYDQDIVVDTSGKKLSLRGFCSCPVDYNCKHVVAAVLRVARDADLAQAISALALPTANKLLRSGWRNWKGSPRARQAEPNPNELARKTVWFTPCNML